MPQRAGASPLGANDAIALCVDLDGTLVSTDTLHESLLLLAKASPLTLLRLPGWVARGRAALKHEVAERVSFDPRHLPYRKDVLALIEQARAEGRPVFLVTAAAAGIASVVAAELGVFDAVLSSSAALNLSRHDKARLLVDRFGPGGFDYIGNHWDDIPALAQARRGYLITSHSPLRRAAGEPGTVAFLDAPSGGLKSWIKALRVHQWLKNGLIFVPLLADMKFGNIHLLITTALAFVAFCLLASATYLINDLLDLPADRQHRTKRYRPFASGQLRVSHAVAVAAALLATSLAITSVLPGLFTLVLLSYAAITTSYSFWLKNRVIVDVVLLAGLYTIRIIAGSAATDIQPSFWLLAFSMFFFLALAMVKRYSELRLALDSGRQLAGRGYLPGDLPVVLALGSSSGMVSALILALYTQSDVVMRHFPAQQWIWCVPPLMLYWMTRLWFKAGRGEIDDDPVVFAARDWQSLAILACVATAFVLGAIGWKPW